MRGEVEAAWVLGGKDCWKYKSNFSRMEGIVSRGKDKQSKRQMDKSSLGLPCLSWLGGGVTEPR